ncbi:hypothetical protein [Actinokineospora inagensis]|uniref:hypothetical protein n=1 Tax=Actinokineospora inagensis TaxID=103730 RepID=UPI0004185130|nr:hypothetical protein [Actinokineospora inagensis]
MNRLVADTAKSWWTGLPELVLGGAAAGGLLYFLGWIRTEATYRELNVPIGVLDFSPVEYTSRGVAVLPPVLLLAAAVIVVLSALHRVVVVRAVAREQHLRILRIRLVIRTLGWLGLVLGALTTAVVVARSGEPPDWLPALMTGSAVALAYVDHSLFVTSVGSFRIRATAIPCIGALGVFLMVISYAEQVGTQYGREFLARAQDRPTAAV